MYILKEDSNGIETVKIGDAILAGKFKNKRCVVSGFEYDDKGQPRVITDKGKFNLYSFRLERLMPEK